MDAQRQPQRLLVGSDESELVEFKEAMYGYDFTKLRKYFSALSNEANRRGVNIAWLVSDVNDRQQVVVTRFHEQW
jgi:ATP-dependent DNA helicase RecG